MWTSAGKNFIPVRSGVRILSAVSAVPAHVAISYLTTVNTAKVWQEQSLMNSLLRLWWTRTTFTVFTWADIRADIKTADENNFTCSYLVRKMLKSYGFALLLLLLVLLLLLLFRGYHTTVFISCFDIGPYICPRWSRGLLSIEGLILVPIWKQPCYNLFIIW